MNKWVWPIVIVTSVLEKTGQDCCTMFTWTILEADTIGIELYCISLLPLLGFVDCVLSRALTYNSLCTSPHSICSWAISFLKSVPLPFKLSLASAMSLIASKCFANLACCSGYLIQYIAEKLFRAVRSHALMQHLPHFLRLVIKPMNGYISYIIPFLNLQKNLLFFAKILPTSMNWFSVSIDCWFFLFLSKILKSGQRCT